MKKLVTIVFLIILIGKPAGIYGQLIGQVVYVSDGDTFHFQDNENGKKYKVRIYGIDAPESSQDHGLEAKAFLMEIIGGQSISLDTLSTDRYGRYIARVYFRQQDVGLRLIAAGMAWHYSYYSDDASYRQAQGSAKKKKLGLWVDSDALPPWEYRRKH